MGEHAPLGLARRPRRVDERGEIAWLGSRTTLFNVFVRNLGALVNKLREIALVDTPRGVHERCVLLHLAKTCDVFICFGNDGNSLGVLKNPLNLARRTGLVDRNERGTGKPHGKVDERPFEARLAHEPHAVARLDACGNEALGERNHLGVKLPSGYVVPTALAVRHAKERAVA